MRRSRVCLNGVSILLGQDQTVPKFIVGWGRVKLLIHQCPDARSFETKGGERRTVMNIIKVILLVLITSCLYTNISRADWIQAGSGLKTDYFNIAIKPNITINSDGILYVAWEEAPPSTNTYTAVGSLPVWLYVKHYNGTTWLQDGGCLNVDPSNHADEASIAINNLVPYVAWREDKNQSNTKYQIYVKHFDGVGWVQDGGSLNIDENKSAFNPQIKIINSIPYVAWEEETENGTHQIYVKHLNDSVWSQDALGLKKNIGFDAKEPSLSFNGTTPYIAYCEYTSISTGDSVIVKHFNGTDWEQVGENVFSSYNTGKFPGSPQLGFLISTPYVSFIESEHLIYVKHLNGNEWVQDGSELYNDAIDFPYPYYPAYPHIPIWSCSLAFYRNTPYIAWCGGINNEMRMYVRHLSSGEWLKDEWGFTAGTYLDPGLVVGDGLYLVWSNWDQVYVNYYTGLSTNTAGISSNTIRAYPNPAKDKINFIFIPDQSSLVKVDIFNFAGERIASLQDTLSAFNAFMIWNCSTIAPGIYLARVNVDGINRTVLKLAIIR